MDPVTGAALISAGSNLISGLFGSSEADKNIKMQKQFAQNGIQWKVADANKAGIHPLYALGAQTHSFAPVQTGVPEAIANMGQDLGRAYQASNTQPEKVDAYTQAIQKINLEKGALENQLLASQIAKLNQTQAPPAPALVDPYMINGQTSSGLVKDLPLARVAHNTSGQEQGTIATVGWGKGPGGRLEPLRSKDFAERAEDDWAAGAMWNLKNRIAPVFDNSLHPPKSALPKGYDYWSFDIVRQEYVPRKTGPKVSRKITPYYNWQGY